MKYPALFEPDREVGGFVVTFPDFGYGVTQGESFAEAYEMAQDLLEGLIGDLIEAGRDLPLAKVRRGKKFHIVCLPALAAAKTQLYQTFRASGMRKAELARRTGIAEANLHRLFDFRHASRLDQIEEAFRALGKRISIEVHAA